MDDDFPTSPAKRQRTMSPNETTQNVALSSLHDDIKATPAIALAETHGSQDVKTSSVQNPEPEAVEDNNFLDVLMQHVEAESSPSISQSNLSAVAVPAKSISKQEGLQIISSVLEEANVSKKGTNEEISILTGSNTSNDDNGVTETKPLPAIEVLPQEPVSQFTLMVQPQLNEETNPSQEQSETSTERVAVSKTEDEGDVVPQIPQLESEQNVKIPAQEGVLSDTDIAETVDSDIPRPEQESRSAEPDAESPTFKEETVSHTHTDANSTTVADISEQQQQQQEMQLDPTPQPELGEVDVPNVNDEDPEWEIDSSPYESSTDTDSSDSSSSDDSDEDADGDYAMLDPEEQARILMQGDGGSDDDGEKHKESGSKIGLRTANEKDEEVIPMPETIVTNDMKIEVLGFVEAIVESTVLVKGKTSGEYQVLESGSLLCLQDRSTVGIVSETFGRVEQPFYTIRFTNDQAINNAGLSTPGTAVYYVLPHSTFVFTQPLAGVKGSDASNFHDEEVGDDEMEFSDDEAEAEHKRQMKLKKQGRRDDASGKGNRGGARGGSHKNNRKVNVPSHSDANMLPTNGSLNYDDEADVEYTPLPRPTNLHEMMGQTDPQEGSNLIHPLPPPPPPASFASSSFRDRGNSQGGFRGRGDHQTSFRGRGGNRGGSGRGRGGYQHNNHQRQQNGYNNGYQNRPYAQPPQQSMGPPAPPNFAYQNQPPPYSSQPQKIPPHAPSLTPQADSYPTTFSPSPISPLPKSGFNLGNFQAHQQHYNTYQNPAQQFQNFQPFPPPPPPPPAFASATGFAGQNMTGNQAAMLQVQRQLEELRRHQQQQ